MKDPISGLVGLLFWAAVIYWLYRRHKSKRKKAKQAISSDNFFLDPSVREHVEREMLNQGVIAGSALQEPRALEAAYRRVMCGIHTDEKVKNEIYKAWGTDHLITTLEQHLLPGQWQWPEFDKWKEIFVKDGEFPYMWKKYPEICLADFENLPIETIFERMLVKNIKAVFDKFQIQIPIKAKKIDLINLAKKNISLQNFCESCPDFYNELKNEFKTRANKGKCSILMHTISMLSCSLRNFYSCKYLKLSCIADCPVETKYSKGKGRITETNIPPFFPGDRTGVTFISRRR